MMLSATMFVLAAGATPGGWRESEIQLLGGTKCAGNAIDLRGKGMQPRTKLERGHPVGAGSFLRVQNWCGAAFFSMGGEAPA